jgi:lipoprotein-anchoring transpeptidase ErfK/SrfK
VSTPAPPAVGPPGKGGPIRGVLAFGLATVLTMLLVACGQTTGRPASQVGAPAASPGSPVIEPTPRANERYAVWATRDVSVWSSPSGGRLTAVFPARQPWGEVTAFLLRQRRQDRDRRTWYQVFLPQRPNGSTGWIPADQVRLVPLTYHVEVDLGRRELRLLRHGRLVHRFAVAIGAAATPTPTGEYFVSAKLRPPRISAVYGPWALGLSAYSDVLDQFGTGDGQIALHGTKDAAALGHAVSHGCVRLDARAVITLARLLPLGSPVTIRA